MRSDSRRGISLVELLVALTLLALGGSAATRLLILSARELDGAELGLRATLLLAEMSGDPMPAAEVRRAVGAGELVGVGDGAGFVVRYEPPLGGGGGSLAGYSGGYFVERSWALGEDEG